MRIPIVPETLRQWAERPVSPSPTPLEEALSNVHVLSSERRRNPRVACMARAWVQGPDAPISGLCADISLGGMFFLGNALDPGQVVAVAVQLGEQCVYLEGEVLAPRAPESAGMAIRFTRHAPAALAALTRHVARSLAA